MSITNLNYFYYVAYYNSPGIDFINPGSQDCAKALRQQNQELANYTVDDEIIMKPLDEIVAPHSIELKTTYPGLLIGTGISHAFGGKGEAALGLYLDYTTGMPYIPGSSVKGTLRSAFCHEQYIRNLLSNAGAANAETINVGELEARIFGNPIDKKKKQYHVLTSEQDIFYDAIITSKGKLLATDAITPHRQNAELMELAEPNPITMIRIRPGVKFKFQFCLKETLGLTAEQKLKVFQSILTDFGIGAKTNVGYGTLEEVSSGGVCEICGIPTGVNARTGQYYRLCNRCNSLRR